MTLQIPDFSAIRALVVGDVMLDRYWSGNTSRISPEAPVPVVHIQETEDRPGGAGNVALNLRALGCQVTLMGFCGTDSAGDELEQQLESAGITAALHRVAHLPTPIKLRILSLHQQLIRLDFEKKFHDTNVTALIAGYQKQLTDADVVILSDYGKGTLQAVSTLIAMANQANVPVLVDPKSQDFSIYRGATLLTPNRKEFEAVVGHCHNEDDIVTKGTALLQKQQFSALLITRGEQGMTLLCVNEAPVHLPARAREVYDVSGAGDTVIATLAAATACGNNFETAAALANIAAGIVVTKLGTATVNVAELQAAIHPTSSAQNKVVSEDHLMASVAHARANKERVVMTNGCFDLLHPGHITYLEQAKALGDRLIIAVNDDASVSRLKGKHRPINPLSHRMAVLAGLAAVDWVVPFSEDTPERLITRVLPDILVKGGDYKVSEIAGGSAVFANGGDVKILAFVPGCSTTHVIQQIQTRHADVLEASE